MLFHPAKIQSIGFEFLLDSSSAWIISSLTLPPIFFSVHIDGIEWMGVKFFQLSSQWQTHIKYFPVAGVSTMLGGGTQTSL